MPAVIAAATAAATAAAAAAGKACVLVGEGEWACFFFRMPCVLAQYTLDPTNGSYRVHSKGCLLDLRNGKIVHLSALLWSRCQRCMIHAPDTLVFCASKCYRTMLYLGNSEQQKGGAPPRVAVVCRLLGPRASLRSQKSIASLNFPHNEFALEQMLMLERSWGAGIVHRLCVTIPLPSPPPMSSCFVP